ncbi:MAG TPA: glycosyltransferase family 39 protein [candidate division Zixibacteria bacterium]|nr:glycosyltransferase family 39 protein [candidate division Zixibacteria bacterium]
MDAQRHNNGWLKYSPALVLTIALMVRLVYLIYYSGQPDWGHLTVDNCYHHNWAMALDERGWIGGTTFFRAPLYIYSLAFLYLLFGSSLWVGRIFGLLVGLASVNMTRLIGQQVGGHRVGFIAGLLHALYPIAIYFDAELLLDPMFTLLFEISVWFWIRWMQEGSRRTAWLCGLWLGLACITRPTGLVLAPVILLFWLVSSDRKKLLHTMLPAVIGLLLPLSLTLVRNLAVADDPVLISSQGGINFYIGNNPNATGTTAELPEPYGANWRIKQITYEAEQAAGHPLRPGQVSSYWYDKAYDWIKTEPLDFITLYLKKLYYSVSNQELSNNRNLARILGSFTLFRFMPLNFSVLFALAIIGLFMAGQSKINAVRLAVLIAVYLAGTALFFCSSRFRLPVVPFLAVLAGLGVVRLIDITKANRNKLAASLAAGLFVGLITFFPIIALPASGSASDAISRGLYQYQQEHYQEALGFFRIARTSDLKYPEVNLNIGATFLRLGQVDSAQHYFLAETFYNPQRWKAWSNLASIALLRDSLTRAEEFSLRALSIAPWDVRANKALLRATVDQPDVDIETIRETAVNGAAKTDNDLSYLNEAAILLTSRQDYSIAQDLLNRAITALPPPIETDDGAFEPFFPNAAANRRIEKAHAHYQLGYILGLNGMLSEAASESRKAISLDPDLQAAYINLTTALRSLGRTVEADSIATLAQKRFPTQ